MTKSEKEKVMKMKTTATWCGYAGLGAEIKDIEYGINDRLVLVLWRGDKKTVHKVKINYSGRVHVKVGRLRINLNECVSKM